MNKVHELEKLILHHKALYYNGNPEITDSEYDKIEEKLKKLSPKNSALSAVGSLVKSNEKVKHATKMLSLGKTYKIEELEKWIDARPCVSTFKVDGVSCSLIYKKGIFFQAKTRGNGTFGEDITQKIIWLDNVRKEIPDKSDIIEVRGEIYCDENSFSVLTEEMNESGLEKPTSQRNIVAGLISRKDHVHLCRHLKFMAFELIGLNLEKETEKFKKLESFKLSTPIYSLHKDIKTVESKIKEANAFMEKGDYQIDGLVFTLDELSLHDELGETAHHPRYKMAFKFEGVTKSTSIEEIVWSISRNGILTPVANVKSIELSGANISRVTLHNYGLVKQHELKKGDIIEITRSGEVIPKFLSVVKKSKNKFAVPTKCPVCDSKVEEKEIRLFCSNKKCPGRLKESILNFIQKIGIDEISSKRLDEMIKSGLVSDIPDLYKLKKEDFLKLEKVKDKLANTFLQQISGSLDASLTSFLASLGITGGAINKCEKVVSSGYNSLEKIKSLTQEQLEEIDSFAEKSSSEFVKSLKEKIPLIKKLEKVGFQFEEKVVIDSKFSGQKFCITGSLSEKRSVVEALIRDKGATVVSSVSKNTDYLVTNEVNSSSSKYKKATSLDIPIITEKELFNILEK